MEATRRKMLEEVMRRLIEGELAMVWALSTEFGEDLARVIRRHLRSMGRSEVITEPGRVEGLVIDVALWFLDHGTAYDPSASLPWVWADKPIRSLVAAEIGHRTVEFEPALAEGEAPSLDPAVVELRSLADREPDGRPADRSRRGGRLRPRRRRPSRVPSAARTRGSEPIAYGCRHGRTASGEHSPDRHPDAQEGGSPGRCRSTASVR